MSSTKGSQKSVLGRGLNALLQDVVPKRTSPVQDNFFQIINIELISLNPCQPRKDFSPRLLRELSISIQQHGLIQPITVRKLDGDNYQLIAGERRLHAAKLAGLTEVAAYIRIAEDQHMLELALIENIQRASLNAIEIALSYQRLLTECALTQEALADRVGKDRTTVSNYLRLLKLPPDIQIAIRDQKISMGHARALINIDDATKQLMLLEKIIKEALSVREVESWAQKLSEKRDSRKHGQPIDSAFKDRIKMITTQLSQQVHSNVVIKANAQAKGEIKILFNSKEDLERIVTVLASNSMQ